MEPGTLTKVLRDFLTTVDGELSLLKEDYLLIISETSHYVTHYGRGAQVISVIDKHWCYGQSHCKTGKFPIQYLHKVDIPAVRDDDSDIYVTIAPFRGEQPGDLTFGKGQIIVGGKFVEPGWISGHTDTSKGVFPETHAWKLDPNVIKSTAKSKVIQRRAKVTTDLKAVLDEELNLTKGEILTVTEVLDDGWCRGMTGDGRCGTFPEGFIQYLEDEGKDCVDDTVRISTVVSSQSTSSACGTYNNDLEPDPLTMPYDDEPAPCYYDLFPQFSREPKTTRITKKDENPNPLSVEPYAITLYPFNAQFPNELSFAAGQVVRLVKHIDSEWAEGSIDDVQGIFPVSYVNIIVDCPESKVQPIEKHIEEEQDENETLRDSLVPGVVCRVEYKFEAQMDGDLSVVEGEFVTVTDMTNEDWVSVKNEAGMIGLCPRGYLSTDFESNSETENKNDEAFADTISLREDATEKRIIDDTRTKRLSEPHRPAPPAPAPGRIPLQRVSPAIEVAQEAVESDEAEQDDAQTAAKQKKAEQRQNVISELVITEKEYVRDLKVTYETFQLYDPSVLESRGIDVAVLFGNILDVIKVAEELLDKMQLAMKGCDEEFQTIGPCFLKMSDKLQGVYVKYCGNHEAALVLLKKYEDNREAMTIFQKGIETLRSQVACFDMSSILIKPVQRILKYPLMLYELVKSTEDGHPDKAELQEAWQAMTDVASYINEYKRRKDLVSKYFDGENTLMRRMAKLNMHSVAKKSTRLSAKLSASLGLTNVAQDLEFEELERQFKSLEKCLWQLARDAEQCIIHLSEEAASGELLSELLHQYYQGTANHEVRKLNETRAVIWSHHFQELKSTLEKRVAIPLNMLTTLLEGPALLILKRYDKLLDLDVAISKSEKNRETKIFQEELAIAKNNYEALNQQLIEELPTLIQLSTKILVSCFGAFANARKLLSGQVTKRYLALSENVTEVTPQDILVSFMVSHNLLWNQITRFSLAGSNPRIEEGCGEWCNQSEKQRIHLRNKYSVDRLYSVIENVVSTSSLDMGAARGTLVAVIKKQDPMGDSTRWFVDNGVIQGFLPKQSLEHWQLPGQGVDESSSSNAEPRSTSPDSTVDLICMDSPEKRSNRSSVSSMQSQYYSNLEEASEDGDDTRSITSESSDTRRYQNLSNVFYYAMYDFDGGITGTLPLTIGQAVRLIRPHDEKRNDAWWLVQDRNGSSGYVPQNYLGLPPT